MSPSPTLNLADLWEIVAAAVPHRTAVVDATRRRTFAEIDDRASRLASWMSDRGVGPGTFVGVQMRNAAQFVETSLAAFKIRAVPVNVNVRLRPAELRHLYGDGPVVGVVHDADLTEPVHTAVAHQSDPPWTLATGQDYELALATSMPAPPVQRRGDDLYVLYTGGTTGTPKGVVWRSEDAFFGCVGGGDPTGALGPITRPAQLLDRLLSGHTFLPVAPLVHAAGMWTTLRWLLAGATVVLQPSFSAAAVWRAVADEHVTTMNIVGDAMAIPLATALTDLPGLDLTSLRTIASGGAPLTTTARARLLAALPDLTIKDSYGSSETGVHGWSVHTAGADGATLFTVTDTVVLDPDTLAALPPGSPGTGVVARRGRVPLRYHGDPSRSAGTFRQIGGHRYALTGDVARHEADGRITVLGRGSGCINTGGEKVFPEEVEAVLRCHPGVADALVVGIADARWGQRVVAVVALGTTDAADTAVTAEALREHCRAELAGFKVPKDVVLVDAVARSVAGKPDYRWARAMAETAGIP